MEGFDLKLVEMTSEREIIYDRDFKNAINKEIQKHTKCSWINIDEYVNSIIESLYSDRWGIVGGYGHKVYIMDSYITNICKLKNPLHSRSHWVIRPGWYDSVKLIPFEDLVLKLAGYKVYIDENMQHERWGN